MQILFDKPEKPSFTGMFKSKYGEQLQGKNWIKNIHKDDLQVFIEIGMACNGHGVLGGLKRASTGKRDSRGRFLSNQN